MSKAYVDTTVLTDALLKPGELGQRAKDALKRFDSTELPTYAIKEFKAGPLRNFIWMHNRLAVLRSFSKALAALQGMSRTPKNYTTSTAIEALQAAAERVGGRTLSELVNRYGPMATADQVNCDEYRLAIRVQIEKAWRQRRTLTTHVVQPLSCYMEMRPFESGGIIEGKPWSCDDKEGCCLAPLLRGERGNLTKLKDAAKSLPMTRERQKRYQTLREIARKPKLKVTDEMCKKLGDAIFIFFAPPDATILTSNVKDHEPLASALGKSVERP